MNAQVNVLAGDCYDPDMKFKRFLIKLFTHIPQHVTKHVKPTVRGRNRNKSRVANVKERSKELAKIPRLRTREEFEDFVAGRMLPECMFLPIGRDKNVHKQDDESRTCWTSHRRHALAEEEVDDIFLLRAAVLRENLINCNLI